MIKGYMLDTVIFNRLLDDDISLDDFSPEKPKLYMTHIQTDEVSSTSDTDRRESLLNQINLIEPEDIATSVGVWGDSYWGACEWGDNDTHALYDSILAKLPKRIKNPFNPTRDARIAVTAIKNDLILLTDDQDLQDAVVQSGYEKNVLFYRDIKLSAILLKNDEI